MKNFLKGHGPVSYTHLARNHLNVAQAEQYVERRLAALQSTPPAGRKTYIIKDVRLFLNSLDRGLRLIREAGVDARTCLLYTSRRAS